MEQLVTTNVAVKLEYRYYWDISIFRCFFEYWWIRRSRIHQCLSPLLSGLRGWGPFAVLIQQLGAPSMDG